MAFSYSPKIVTEGLVLYLDAGNQLSYPGSGTTWTDLSRSMLSGSLVNGPTYSSANLGSIILDGVNDYISLPPDPNLSFPGNTPFSCELIVKNNGFTNSNFPAILSFGETDGGGVGGWNALFYKDAANLYTGPYGSIDFSRLTTPSTTTVGKARYDFTSISDSTTLNSWFYVYNPTVGSNLYRNSTLVTTDATTGSSSTTNLTNYYIGRRGNDSNRYVSNTNVYSLKLYNRALSAQEVLQNYNATKTRFGLT
jgi:hypothetical protein